MAIIKSKTIIIGKIIFGPTFESINFILFGNTDYKEIISLGDDDYLIW